MSAVGLLFVGAVLFVNGLLFLGKVDPKSAGVFNLFVGALQTAIPFWLISHATTPDEILAAAGIFLFGFTYLYVGIGNLKGYDASGLGWYSLWVAVVAAGFGVTNIVRFDDTPTGLLWLQWSVLWTVFFVVLALGVTRLTAAAGWLTLIQSFTTCTVPGLRDPAGGVGRGDQRLHRRVRGRRAGRLRRGRAPRAAPRARRAVDPADVRVPVSA